MRERTTRSEDGHKIVYSKVNSRFHVEVTRLSNPRLAHLATVAFVDSNTDEVLFSETQPIIYFMDESSVRFSPTGVYALVELGGVDPVLIFSWSLRGYVKVPKYGKIAPSHLRFHNNPIPLGFAKGAIFADRETVAAGSSYSWSGPILYNLRAGEPTIDLSGINKEFENFVFNDSNRTAVAVRKVRSSNPELAVFSRVSILKVASDETGNAISPKVIRDFNLTEVIGDQHIGKIQSVAGPDGRFFLLAVVYKGFYRNHLGVLNHKSEINFVFQISPSSQRPEILSTNSGTNLYLALTKGELGLYSTKSDIPLERILSLK